MSFLEGEIVMPGISFLSRSVNDLNVICANDTQIAGNKVRDSFVKELSQLKDIEQRLTDAKKYINPTLRDFNPNKAFKIFKDIAENADATDRQRNLAKHQLGLCYLKGIGTSIDIDLAIENIQFVANNGKKDQTNKLNNEELIINLDGENPMLEVADAQRDLGWVFKECKSLGIEPDPDKSQFWFSKARSHYHFIINKQPKNDQALYNLARLHQRGYGGDADLEKATDYYKAAADLGNAHAMNNLGWLKKQDGIKKLNATQVGSDQDFKEAKQYFFKSIEAAKSIGGIGHPLAEFNLGTMYLKGYGVVRNEAKARDYFVECAKYNRWLLIIDPLTLMSSEGSYAIGYIYYTNIIEMNDAYNQKAAIEWLLKAEAADDYDRDASYLLGKIYEYFIGDINQAKHHYRVAKERGHKSVETHLKLLEESKISNFINQNTGCNSLHALANLGRTSDINNLLDNDSFIDINYAPRNGRPPLQHAVLGRHKQCVQYLLTEHRDRIDITYQDKDGETALHLATKQDDAEVLELLLMRQPDVLVETNNEGKTIFDIALERKKPNCLLLLGKEKKYNGENLLYYIIKCGSKDQLESLNKIGAPLSILQRDINKKNCKGNTPLQQAVMLGKLDCVEYLLANHADMNIENNDKQTALMLAVENGDPRIVECLLKYETTATCSNIRYQKTDTSITFKYETPIEIAQRINSPYLLSLLFENRHVISEEYLKDILVKCSDHFKKSNGDKKIISQIVSRLVHTDIDQLQDSTCLIKFFAHWAGLAVTVNTKEGANKLDGWFPDEFLSLYCFYLFELILEIYNNTITLPKAIKDKEDLINKLIKELCCNLETLRAVRDLIICKQFSGNTELRQSIVKNIFSKIKQLKNSDPYCYNAGFDGHSVYLNVIGEEIIIAIDNFGDGTKEYHVKGPEIAGVQTRYPYAVRIPRESLNDEHSKFKTYLTNIIKERFSNRARALKALYQLSSYGHVLSKKELMQLFTPKPEQPAKNCVTYNFKVGAERRLGPDIYNFVEEKINQKSIRLPKPIGSSLLVGQVKSEKNVEKPLDKEQKITLQRSASDSRLSASQMIVKFGWGKQNDASIDRHNLKSKDLLTLSAGNRVENHRLKSTSVSFDKK